MFEYLTERISYGEHNPFGVISGFVLRHSAERGFGLVLFQNFWKSTEWEKNKTSTPSEAPINFFKKDKQIENIAKNKNKKIEPWDHQPLDILIYTMHTH